MILKIFLYTIFVIKNKEDKKQQKEMNITIYIITFITEPFINLCLSF